MQVKSAMKVVTGAILSLALFASATAAGAAEFRSGRETSVGAGEQVKSNAYLAGGSVTSAGKIDGDLLTAGGTIVVSGAVAQDLAAAGGNLNLLGAVGGDLRAAGGTIVVGGEVKGDAALAGGQTTVSGKVGGDVAWMGGSFRLDAPVDGNLLLTGGEATLNAPVKGNVTFNGGTLTLGPGAVIEGNLSYHAASQATFAEGSAVHGTISYEPRQKTRGNVMPVAAIAAFASVAFILKFLMETTAALVLGLMFRRRMLALSSTINARPLHALGWGFASLFVIPAATVALMVTVVGIPLGLLAGLAFGALILLSHLALPVMIGTFLDRKIMRRGEDRLTWVTILIGALAILVLKFIPFLGWLALFAAFLIVFGTLVEMAKDGIRRMR